MKKFIKIMNIFVISASILNGASCWTPKDDEHSTFKELESNIVLSFKDAVDCKPLENDNNRHCEVRSSP